MITVSTSRAWTVWTWLGAVLTVLGLSLFSRPAFAEFKPPTLDGHVVDTANALTHDQILALDYKLEDVRTRYGFEIVAFVAGSLEGEAKEDVAYTCFNTWKLGQKGADNGVLLLVAPKERKTFLATGKGVEGALTDLQSDDILNQQVIPALKENRIYDAVDHGTSAIARTLSGAPGGPATVKTPGRRPAASEPLTTRDILIIVGVVVVMIVLSIVSSTFRSILSFFFQLLFIFGGRGGGGGGGGGGSGFSGGGGSSGGGGAGEDY